MSKPTQIRPLDVGYDRQRLEKLLAAMTVQEMQSALDWLQNEWGQWKPHEREHPVAAATQRDCEAWQMVQIREAIATRSRQ